MAEWLKQCGVKTVVMQSTGVYWIPVFDVLEEAGFNVWLANAQQTKNLPGRKSDVQESQWLLKLHTYGLLGKGCPPPEKNNAAPKRKKRGNEPNFDMAGEWKRVAGVDLTRIDGIKVSTVQTVFSEAGLDMSKWPTEHHFTSWIGLCPAHEISGGKILKRKSRKVVSRLATALRLAATTLRESDSYLGAQFRRLRTRLGSPKAITAMAAKLARLIYRMLRFGQEYIDQGESHYNEKYREQQILLLKKKARQHGFHLVPASAST
jgi:hypothetical protein